MSLERPNSINIAVNAIQNLCADNNGRAARNVIKRWKGRVERAATTALETRSGIHQSRSVVDEGALLTTLSQLLQTADMYRKCLAIEQPYLDSLATQILKLDPTDDVVKQYTTMYQLELAGAPPVEL